MQSVFFPSPSIGYIVGWNGQILKTNDGGTNWIQQTPVAIYGNLDVFFVDDTTGYIVGGQSSFAGIQKTTDGGINWVGQSASVNYGLTAVFFINSLLGYSVGSHGTILKTINGGVIGISENTITQNIFSTFPNPATSEIVLDFSRAAYYSVQLLNTRGEILIQATTSVEQIKIDLRDFSKGVYFVSVRDDKNNLAVRKIVKM